MDTETIRMAIARVRRGSTNRDVLDVCDFAEKCLGSKPKLSELERKEKEREYMKGYRARLRMKRLAKEGDRIEQRSLVRAVKDGKLETIDRIRRMVADQQALASVPRFPKDEDDPNPFEEG
jgi:hypothetical protein